MINMYIWDVLENKENLDNSQSCCFLNVDWIRRQSQLSLALGSRQMVSDPAPELHHYQYYGSWKKDLFGICTDQT